VRVHLVNYDPAWPARFAEESRRLRDVIGAGALRIEHAGSTSVPGLVAKPVIDIILEVQDSGDESAYAALLEGAGYRFHLREPAWHEHRLFKGAADGANVHVFSRGCPEIDRMLAFRDRLRANAEDRHIYAAAKRALAEQEWERMDDYASAKTAVVEQILSRR